ncbi:hypothetical protein [Taibaiella koreensis]|uniref:hypothetical protein n=1 Tax=Taibaiella koreensis TaxID=1268548 RepID=UPI000E59F871|nr:hypothetical protein [Taibaiella koreensis]
MHWRYILLSGLIVAGCKESADHAREVQQESLRQFDSINKTLEESNARVLRDDSPEDHLQSAKRRQDSLLHAQKHEQSEAGEASDQ